MSIDAQILLALRQTSGGAVSGADLAARLNLSRAAVWARIEELRKLGYEIEASPHGGYRLLSAPDLLLADDLMAMVGPESTIGRDIRVFQETGSTNDIVDKMGRDEVPEGVVVFAESQTKGRGRLGREWVSPPGRGLWFSILLRPALPPQAATQITIAAATGLARAIKERTHVAPEIKWPNDLLVRGRKLCGILTEMSAELDTIRYVVLGIGLNVNFAAEDWPPALRPLATSLRLETGHPIRRTELAAAILRELNRDYQRVRGGAFESLADEWERQCSTIGQNVEVCQGTRKLRGRAEALDAEGALLLRTDHGHLERIVGGDVTLRG